MAYYNFSDRPTLQRIREIATAFELDISADSVNLYLVFQQVYRDIEKSYTHIFEKFDLSESRFAILMFLFYSEGMHLLPSEIASKLGVTRPTASKLIKGMNKQGFVTVQPSSLDKRTSFIKITNTGIETLKLFLPYNYQVVDLLFEDFSAEEKKQFYILLDKLSHAKQKIKLWEESIDGNN